MQLVQHGQDALFQLSIMWVLEPGAATKGVGRLHGVTGRAVVNNEHLVEVSAQSAQVFDVHALELQAVLSIKTKFNAAGWIEKVNHRISIIGEGGRKDDHLKELCRLAKELIHTRTLTNIDRLEEALTQMHWHDQIGIWNGLKSAMNEGLIQI